MYDVWDKPHLPFWQTDRSRHISCAPRAKFRTFSLFHFAFIFSSSLAPLRTAPLSKTSNTPTGMTLIMHLFLPESETKVKDCRQQGCDEPTTPENQIEITFLGSDFFWSRGRHCRECFCVVAIYLASVFGSVYPRGLQFAVCTFGEWWLWFSQSGRPAIHFCELRKYPADTQHPTTNNMVDDTPTSTFVF